MSWFRRLFGAADAGASNRFVRIARGRGYTFDVVGESHWQHNLDEICGGKCEEGYRLEVDAQLVFVTNNPADPNAVGVMIEGKAVGYIPRDLAVEMRRDILRLNPSELPVVCEAMIVGGWDRGQGDEGHYGVKLNVSSPLRLAKG